MTLKTRLDPCGIGQLAGSPGTTQAFTCLCPSPRSQKLLQGTAPRGPRETCLLAGRVDVEDTGQMPLVQALI